MSEEKIPSQVGAGIALHVVPDLPDEDHEVVEGEVVEEASPAGSLPDWQTHPDDLSPLDALRQEMLMMVADIEFRLAQTYEMKRRMEQGADGVLADRSIGRVYVEDIHDQKHRLTGYTLLNNSNGTTTVNGSIAWKNLHVVFLGVDYTIADGSTTNKYAWFIKPASGTTATLTTGNTLPVLTPNDALIFVNNGGIATSATETSLPAAVAPGSVTQDSLASDVSVLLGNIQDDLAAVQAQADGAVTSYFQDDPPWPDGAASPSGAANNEVGDIWYDSNDGGAFRWSGTQGTPTPNVWVRIADTDTSSLAAKVNTKVTTYVGTSAPTAPAGGHTNGDMWIDTTGGGNVLKRWNGSWQTLQFGDAAISGVGATKVSGVLAAGNIPTLDIGTKTTGTLTGSRVGSGINGANLTNGSVNNAQLAQNAVQPKNINAAFHLLY